ncbi:MAG: ABC transporter ATP-binding protein [Thermoplasmata archaeon]
MTDPGAMIAVDRLARRYDRPVAAVEGLSFSIRRGEIFGLLGPNGAGKTTTIRLMAGLIWPTEGEVRVGGWPTTDAGHLEEIHQAVGVLPEVPGLYEDLSAMRNLRFFGRLHGLSDSRIEERAREFLERFDLWERRDDKVATFSKGMKQKVAIARALLHDPPCLILDEPISGLDPEAAKAVRDFLAAERDRGRTVVLSTHNLDEADRLSDRVAVIRSRLLALDTPQRLKSRLFGGATAIRLAGAPGPEAASLLRAIPGVLRVDATGPELEVETAEPERDVPEVVAALVRGGFRIQRVAPQEHSLEDVYLKLVQESGVPLAEGSP